jgi:type IV pilus assembly protein PilA
MFNLAQLRAERRAKGDDGFTLIELLVVVVIIGILIAIAIPLYLNYKKGANDKSAQSDLRGAISVLEQCNADNNGYPSSFPIGTATANACGGVIKTSSGTTLTYYANTTAPANTSFILFAVNSSGNVTGAASSGYYCYASAAGGPVVKKTAATPTAYASSC